MLVRQQIVFAGIAAFGLVLATGGITSGLAVTLLGTLSTSMLVRWGRRLEAMRTYFDVQRAIHDADPARASQLLDLAARRGVPLASIPHAIAFAHAEIAIAEGRASDALEHARQGLTAPVGVLDPVVDRALARDLRALSAVAHAKNGDDDEARAIVTQVELDIASSPRALACATVAACTTLARGGRKVELAERLARGRRFLDLAGSTQERSLAHALGRFARTPSPSVYRRVDVGATSDEADWIAAATGGAAVPAPGDVSQASPLFVEAATPRAPPRQTMGWDVLRQDAKLASIVVLMLSALLVLPALHSFRSVRQEVPVGVLTALTSGNFIILVFAVGGMFWASRQRLHLRTIDRFTLASGAWARGDTASAMRSWEALARHPIHRVAAEAGLALGRAAIWQGDVERCLVLAERALGKLALDASAASFLPLLEPELTALWAVARAVSSPQEARAAAATLPDDVLRVRSRFRIELVARVADGDLVAAADWAEGAKRDTTFDGYDELLADAVRLVVRGPALGASERSRIAGELTQVDKSRYLEGVAPGLVQRARAASSEAMPPSDTAREVERRAHDATTDIENEVGTDIESEVEAESDATVTALAHLRFTTRAT